MIHRGLRKYPCFKRYLSKGDFCYAVNFRTGEIFKVKVLEVIDWTFKSTITNRYGKKPGWREGCVYYFVEDIVNEVALGEEVFLTRREAELAFKHNKSYSLIRRNW